MGLLNDKVAIVTGGAMGIGGATSRMLANEGAAVLVADIDEVSALENVERIRNAGGTAEPLSVDVSDMSAVAGMVERASNVFGGVHILVNNAWARKDPDGSVESLSETGWDHSLDVMVKAHFIAAKNAAPLMRRAGYGSIVNIASVHGQYMAPRRLSYDTAKAAVIGLTRQMAIDLGPDGIRVNAICPGLVLTEHSRKFMDDDPALFALTRGQYPVGRTGTPDDIANAIVFLCSEDASFITGHTLNVDGGMTIQVQENLGVAQAELARTLPGLDL